MSVDPVVQADQTGGVSSATGVPLHGGQWATVRRNGPWSTVAPVDAVVEVLAPGDPVLVRRLDVAGDDRAGDEVDPRPWALIALDALMAVPGLGRLDRGTR